MSSVDVQELTISEAQQGFKSGQFTSKTLCEAFFTRIRDLDKSGPRINSTLALSTTALDEANALDEFFEETGNLKGPLHGIPILVKDQADTKGMITTYGSAAAKTNIPDEDAVVVKKLKEAGAIVLGKTTVAEWAATWFSANGATDYEFTKNPYNLEHDVGASSGGSGAAVAANLCILAIGEDTGGSIRVPASFCNIIGLRVTPGLISRTGFCPLVKVQDTPGPMARTVTDCAIMLDSMVGFDPQDEFTGIAATAAAAGLPRGGSYAAHLEDGPGTITRARIGVLRQRFGPDSDAHCREVNAVMESAMRSLSAHGTTFIDVSIDGLEHYLTYTQTHLLRSRSDINSFLASKPNLPNDLADIVPKVPAKPYLDLVSGMAHGPLNPLDDPTYADRILQRDELKRKVDCLLAEHNLDALLLPDAQIPPPRCDDAYNARFEKEEFPTNTFLASQARLPAISVPAGFTDGGLPIGMQMIGLEYQEQRLLELARGIEVLAGKRRAPVIA